MMLICCMTLYEPVLSEGDCNSMFVFIGLFQASWSPEDREQRQCLYGYGTLSSYGEL